MLTREEVAKLKVEAEAAGVPAERIEQFVQLTNAFLGPDGQDAQPVPEPYGQLMYLLGAALNVLHTSRYELLLERNKVLYEENEKLRAKLLRASKEASETVEVLKP